MTAHRRASDREVIHHRTKTAAAIVSFAIIFGFLITLAYWALYPYNVIEHCGEAVTEVDTVHQGDVITYRSSYIKHLDLPATTRRQFVDGLIFDAGTFESNLPVGRHDVVRELEIPKTLPPGQYYVLVTLTYQVNPIREMTYETRTNAFEVLPAE